MSAVNRLSIDEQLVALDVMRPTQALKVCGLLDRDVVDVFGEGAVIRLPWRGTHLRVVKAEAVRYWQAEIARIRASQGDDVEGKS